MVAIRDLKGRPVEETVNSRATGPWPPDPGQVVVEREAIRRAVEKVTALKGERPPRAASDDEEGFTFPGSGGAGGEEPGEAGVQGNMSIRFNKRIELPPDIEAALGALELTLVHVEEHVALMRAEITNIRLRAEKDAGKLARLAELLKQIGE